MPIIRDIYPKIGLVLRDMIGVFGIGTSFTADEVVRRFEAKFPADRALMDHRRIAKPGAHSLRGYLDGMLAEYSKKPVVPGPPIAHLGILQYRFL